MKEIKRLYSLKKEAIKARLSSFRSLNEKDYFNEFLFCMLTPGSNAQKCWEAVQLLSKMKDHSKPDIADILRTKTRFHNNKAGYIINSKEAWSLIKPELENENRIELRKFIAENVKGYGLKEASHFLRNVGKSDNQIAILDRHILKNLKRAGVIRDEKIKSKKHYLEIEQAFLAFSDKINIPIDELDLLFWSQENGEIFK